MFIKDVCIACLAELIKFSSPWYIRSLFHKIVWRICVPTILLILIMSITVLIEFEHNTLYPSFSPDDRVSYHFSSPLMISTKTLERNFPTPEELKYHVQFWRDVFARYTSRQLILHDNCYFQVVYEVIDRSRSPDINATIQKYKRLLLALDHKEQTQQTASLTPEEARIFKMFESISEEQKFRKAAYRMRTQGGQRDRFLEAIQTSGLYQHKFEQIFRQHGLPIELTRIPFVESYFNHTAYSYAGAAGIWQFMPATARMYGLRVNYNVDERYDPFKSAESAAQLLKANYDIFQSWPLAVTAYHHGPAGIINAMKQLDTTDLGKIVRTYRGEKFGFYSRNYYTQFLAAAQVMHDPERYFGTVTRLPPLYYEQVTINRKIFMKDLVKTLSIPKDELLTLNRDLKRAIRQSKLPLPKNFVIKLPPGKKAQFLTHYADL